MLSRAAKLCPEKRKALQSNMVPKLSFFSMLYGQPCIVEEFSLFVKGFVFVGRISHPSFVLFINN